MSETTPAVSHGRGGAGNIAPDDTQYVDGGIHREGDPAATGGAYSAGRGGAGNIGSPAQKPLTTGNDDDIIPENAKVQHHDDQVYHTGRGGEGNVELPKKEGEEATKPAKTGGLKAKIKALLAKLKSKKEKKDKTETAPEAAPETVDAPAETTTAEATTSDPAK
ncbi:hypothetical protein EX30DRAFT_236653 [Ascodesmis nigricans]|uniref:Uncharacterized protein n=1 Tax=Ascodesmis nigricans TaxID=341454 RepID=A0A4S2MZ22_9PEZI|nr:hypothetical protein EX30DRAFT_236653 [Ascodesmis nigricans]